MDSEDLFNRSILVVAHPDDEVLWFSSILEKVNSICFSYMECPEEIILSEGRKKVISHYPLPNIKCLNIKEPKSFNMANWQSPIESEYGLKLKNKFASNRYQKSYLELVERLEDILDGFSNVFTHNPWGEYGHEDHVQIFRAVQFLSSKYNFNVWYSNYCGNRAIPLMLRSLSGFTSNYHTLKTNVSLANKLSNLYKTHSCWTWYNNYCWFQEESFMQMPKTNEKKQYGHIFPLNMIKTDFDNKGGILNRINFKHWGSKNIL